MTVVIVLVTYSNEHRSQALLSVVLFMCISYQIGRDITTRNDVTSVTPLVCLSIRFGDEQKCEGDCPSHIRGRLAGDEKRLRSCAGQLHRHARLLDKQQGELGCLRCRRRSDSHVDICCECHVQQSLVLPLSSEVPNIVQGEAQDKQCN